MSLQSKIILLVVLLSVSFMLQLFVGTEIDFNNNDYLFLFSNFRIPSAVSATIAGALLSVSGLFMQTYFRNPLAGPYVTGVSAGASLGIAILIFISSFISFQLANDWLVFVFSFIGSFLVFLLVISLSRKLKSTVGLLLIGLMISGTVSAFVELFQLMMTNASLRDFFMWSRGNFYSITFMQLWMLLLVFIIVMLFSVYLCKSMDLLLLGEDLAKLSGINIKRTEFLAITTTALSAGVVTAFCGPIGFVGMAVPHIARMLLKTNFHLPLIIGCVLIGGIITGLCNALSLSGIFGLNVPVNIITAFLGSPFVIFLIIRTKNIL
jgi:iron complex transport system permease protein